MTSTEIETLARQKYNASGDTFFGTNEILSYIWQGEMALAREAHIIERVYTTPSVASQQQYDVPSNTIALKRIEYAGQKLKQITMKEDDLLTFYQSATTATGTPEYYFLWNESFFLRPIPAVADDTIKVYSINEADQLVLPTQALDIPSHYHLDLVDFVVLQMAIKDQNHDLIAFYAQVWEKILAKAKKDHRKSKFGDEFRAVTNVDNYGETLIGTL